MDKTNVKVVVLKRPVIVFVLICFLVTSLSVIGRGQSKKDSVWILSETGCKIYNPNPQKDETITWSGSCVDGFANGEGKLQWFKNGKLNQLYVGSMRRGFPYGNGKYDYGNGSIKEGVFKEGALNGEGTILTKNKRDTITYYFKGELQNGIANGYGKLIERLGNGDTLSVYEGYFVESEMHGMGLLREFDFRNDVTVTKGLFQHGRPDGEVEIWKYKKDKQVLYYKGGYQNKKKKGFGLETTGLTTYRGEWKDGKKYGRGILLMDSIVIYDGDWKNGEFNGVGKRSFFDGSYCIGEYKNNQRSGFGAMYWPDGTKFIGEFRMDLYDGLGFVIHKNKIISSGRWENGKRIATESYVSVRKQLNEKYADKIRLLNVSLN